MKQKYLRTECCYSVLLFFFFLISAQLSYADGSKDFYPSGTTGGRAKLRSSNTVVVSWPFPNLNTHYVYAKVGEQITMASSVIGIGSGAIELTLPDGTTIQYNNSGNRITNRAQEVAGPNNLGGSGYAPATYHVTTAGIYKVDFIAPRGTTSNINPNGRANIAADADWNNPSTSDDLISAWDVSVINQAGNAFVHGRVYATILNLDIYNNWSEARGFYGKMFVLTNDGYTYRVNNNGSNGYGFEFFVNNKGFVDASGNSIYKSLNTSINLQDDVKDPRTQDTATDFTQKMFYTLPAADLPASSSGAVPGGTTWLKGARVKPKVTLLKANGVEGTSGRISSKGGKIEFEANLPGKFTVVIRSTTNPSSFPSRTIEGYAIAGHNEVPWDGKDGAGNPLPVGTSPAEVTVQLQGAEVHFPYFDVEINPRGLILELLSEDNSSVESDVVYWDDTPVDNHDNPNAEHSNPAKATPTGVSSNSNGHKWGSYLASGNGTGSGNTGTGSYSFGNEKSMDTWTFILGEQETLETDFETLRADLKINSITPNKTLVAPNDNVTYTVEVQNSDGSNNFTDIAAAPYSFSVPAGLEIISVTPVSSCGGVDNLGEISADKQHYNSKVDLPNGCKITYTIVTKVVNAPSGPIEVKATIMRPPDVTDPDATNPDPNSSPTNPHLECKNGTATEDCNNIKYSNAVTAIHPKITLVKSVTNVGTGDSGKFKEGEVIEYKFVVKNEGDVPLTSISLTESLPDVTLSGKTGDTGNDNILSVNEEWTYTGQYTVKKSDGDPAKVVNQATVKANDPNGDEVSDLSGTSADKDDPTEAPVEQNGKISLVKTVTSTTPTGGYKLGDVIDYQFTVKNEGNVTLDNVVLTDNIAGITPAYQSGDTNSNNKLDIDESWIYTASYTITQSDVDAGKVSNTAVVTSKDPSGNNVTDNSGTAVDNDDPTETPIPQEGKVSLVKSVTSATPAGGYKLNDVIDYQFVVKNEGNVTLSDVSLTDNIPGVTPAYQNGDANGNNKLDVGENWTYTASYTITQADVDAGKVSNTAVVTSKDPSGNNVTDNSGTDTDNNDPTETLIPQNGKISLVKSVTSATPTGGYKLNDVIDYQFVVKNEGNVTLSDVSLTDNIPGVTPVYASGDANGNNKLDVGESWTYTASYTIVQSDVDAGKVSNTAVVNSKDPSGNDVTDNSGTDTDNNDPTETLIPQNGKISLVKSVTSATPAGGYKLNDVIDYQFVVKNEGNVTLSDVSLTDNIPGVTPVYASGDANGNNKLDVGESWTYTASYTITQADVDTGKVSNTAVVNSKDPSGNDVTDNSGTDTDNNDPTETLIPQNGKISLVKSVTSTTPTGGYKLNDVIDYQFTVKNEGNVTLDNVVLTDNIAGVTPVYASGDANGNNKLDVGESWTYTASYTIVQSDVDAGKVSNTAVVRSKDPSGNDVTDNSGTDTDNNDPTETLIPQNGKISLVKSVTSTTPAGGYKLGDKIDYQFIAKNEGNVTLSDVSLTDNIPGVVPTYQSGDANGNNKLDVGESWTYTASYTITQSDVDAGKVSNTAVVTSKDPSGNDVTDNSGTDTDNNDPTETLIPQNGKISLVKSVTSATPAGGYKLGDKIDYQFVAKNEGNVTLDNVVLTDNIVGVVPAYQSGDTNNNNKLDVGESWTYTASYTITQADVDAGKVSNTAVVTSKDPSGNDVTDNSGTDTDNNDPTETLIPQNGRISLVKSVTSTTPTGGYKLNDVIDYQFTVKNEGNVTLDNVVLTDNIPGVTPAYQSGDTNNNSKLDVGESWVYTASYTITQADVDAGKVSNTAMVTSKDPSGNDVTDNSGTDTDNNDPTETLIPQNGKISLVKSVTSTTPTGGYKLGDKIDYQFVAKNEGNVTLDNVVLTDNIAGITPTYQSGDANNNSKLDVDESWVYTASYTITQADVDAGKVSNTAVVTSKDPSGNDVTDNSGTDTDNNDPTETLIPQKGKISLVKSVTSTTPTGGYKLGDKIDYQFVAKNEGNVTLDNVVLTDNIAGVVPAYQSGDANGNNKLDVGESWVYTASYTIKQSDVDAGKVSNTAVVTSKDPSGNDVTDNSGTDTDNNDPTETLIPQNGKISLVKSVTSATPTGGYKLDDKIDYQFVVKNEGNVTLDNVVLIDNIAGVTPVYASGDANGNNKLDVGESWVYTANYTITQSDVDAGKVSNTAVVTSKDPSGNDVTDNSGTDTDNNDPTETPIPQNGKISLVKSVTSATPAGGYKLGDRIDYQFVAKNEGNVTLSDVSLTDNIPGVVPAYQSGDANGNNKLDVGESWVYTASYTIKQSDVDAGKVSNTAVVTSKDPSGNNVTDNSGTAVDNNDPTETLIPQNGKISLVKSVTSTTPTGGYKLNDVIDYQFTVKNEGNVTLDNVVLTDNIAGVTPVYSSGDANGNNKLDVGESWTYTASYTITQSDVDAGKVSNTAVVTSKDPSGNDVTDNSGTDTDNNDPTETLIPQNGKISLVKSVTSATPAGGYKLGDRIDYQFVAKNEGNVTLDNVVLTDNIAGVVPAYQSGDTNNNSKLDVGESWVYTASYTITQADVDAGKVSNTAMVTSKDPSGNDVTDNSGTDTDNNDPTETLIPQNGRISLVKSVTSATPAGGYKLGDRIDYQFVAKNEGNVTLSDVSLTDNIPGITPVYASGDANGNNKLDVGESWTYTASYTITQADVDAGKVSNTAVVTSKDPSGNDVTDNSGTDTDNNDPTETLIPQNGRISLVKSVTSATPTGGYKLGDRIDYQLVAKNEGNVTLDNVVLTDNIAGITPTYQSGDANGNNKLDVGESWTYTASYTITQSDVDAGKVSNTAVVTSKDPSGNDVTDNSGTDTDNNDPTETLIPQNGKISLVKSVTSTTPAGGYKLGDRIDYQFVAKNEGNVTLSDISLTDNIASVTPVYASGDANGNNKLDVGESWTYTASYTITQSDVDAGKVSNTAVVTSKDPSGNDVADNSGTDTDNNDPTESLIPQDGKISLVKSVTSATPTGGYKLNDVIDYQFTVKNEGNVTLDNVVLTDNIPGVVPAYQSGDANGNNKLDVGESWVYTASYTITQSDVDAGKVSNTAVVTSKDPSGNDVTDNSGTDTDNNDPTETPIPQNGKISLVKSVTNVGTGTNGAFILGNQIEYTFTVTNTGNVSLKDLVLTDPLLTNKVINIPGVLEPGKSITHIEKYTITDADVALGKVTNSAVIKANDPAGNEVKDHSGTAIDNDNPTVTIVAKPPVANDDAKDTMQNKPVTIDVQKNDQAGSSPIVPGSTVITKQPKHGTVVVNADGTVTYTPNEGYTGTDEFEYTVTDVNGQISNPAKVTININPSTPEATDDSAETEWNKEVKIPILDNDKPFGAPLDITSVEITEQPKHGTIRVNADGTVTYLPNSGYTGTDTFKYRVKDANGNWTNVATVTIKVTGFFIPNVITPNGDGKNDAFVIVGLENYNNAQLTIFNRWGNEVYRNTNYKNTWTGDGLNEGTYYYLLRLKDGEKEQVFKGWILLKR